MTEPNPYFPKFLNHLSERNWVVLASEKFPTCRLYNPSAKMAYPPDYIQQRYVRFVGKGAKETDHVNIAAYIIKQLPLVSGEVFQPSAPRLVSQHDSLWINAYRAYEPSSAGEVSQLFHEYLERLFPNDSERKVCIQWIAHIFQRPAERPSWHLLLSSDTGVGKGFLVENILAPLLCMQTATASSYTRITERFSTLFSDNLLVLLDDPKAKSDDQMTKIKSALTEPRVLVERKNEDAKMAPTFARIILASNEEKPLKLDENERRWYAVSKLVHKENAQETQAFITELAKWLNTPGALDGIYHWFMAVDLKDFNPKHIFQTDTLKRMIGASKDDLEEVCSDYFDENPVLKQAELKQYIIEAGYHPPQNRGFTALLSPYYDHLQLTPRGKPKSRYWVKKGWSKADALAFLIKKENAWCTDNARMDTSTIPF